MKQSTGALIARLRKEKGMTQAQLAQQMCVTDKAVSKWERGLSCPDIAALPKLAQLLGVPLEQLLQGETSPDSRARDLFALVLRAVSLAMGIAAAVLSLMGQLEPRSGMTMLGVGLACVSLYLLQK